MCHIRQRIAILVSCRDLGGVCDIPESNIYPYNSCVVTYRWRCGEKNTQMQHIENYTSRKLTFSKWRNCILKKAFKLSMLSYAEVALIIFSRREKLYEFSSSRKEYFEIPWASLRAMVEPSFAERTVINHSDYLTNGQLVVSTAVNIRDNEVLTSSGQWIAYDYLVIATGHLDHVPKTRTERLKQYQAESEKIKSANSILIVGGGPTGVELAGEIVVDFPDKKVTLVHRGSRLLEFIGAKASKKALDWLTSKKVEVLLNQSVDINTASDGTYQTSGGETIRADCHFVCTGKPIGSSWLKDTILKDNLDGHGKLVVDDNLRVRGLKNVFAIGDITAIPEIQQGYLAQRHAVVAAKNIKMLMSGEKETKLATYKPGSAIAIVSLGRRDAVAQLPFATICGCIPGMIKSRDLFVEKTRKQMGLKPTLT